MPRKAREILQGEYYHVLSRGNNRQDLFRETADIEFYLSRLSRYQLKFQISIFHYCIMTNHVHFLLRSNQSERGITKLMHGLQTAYASYFKKKNGATGHVFENRFKHLHIGSASYLLECGRYIERNPVRAKMVSDPNSYPWSSYSFYAYGQTNDIVEPNPEYLILGSTPVQRQDIYRKYIEIPRPYEVIVDRFFDEHVLI